MPDFHATIVRSAVDGDTVFAEVHRTGTRTDGTPLEERGVIVMGIRDDRISWGRLDVDEVEREWETSVPQSVAWQVPPPAPLNRQPTTHACASN